MRYKQLAVIGSALLLSATLAGCGGQSTTQNKPTPQPQVTWSVNQLEVVLSPGETTSRNVNLTTNIAVQNLVLEAAPAISPFVTFSPSSFASVPAGQPQPVHIVFATPSDTAYQTYQGFIQARLGGQVLLNTLTVLLPVSKRYSSTLLDLPVTFDYPPSMIVDVPTESSAETLLVKDPDDDLDDAGITIGRRSGDSQSFVNDLLQSLTVVADVTDTQGAFVWRTLTLRESDSGLEFITSFTTTQTGIYFVSSKNYPALSTVRQVILASFAVE
jgi:hypothetical protein